MFELLLLWVEVGECGDATPPRHARWSSRRTQHGGMTERRREGPESSAVGIAIAIAVSEMDLKRKKEKGKRKKELVLCAKCNAPTSSRALLLHFVQNLHSFVADACCAGIARCHVLATPSPCVLVPTHNVFGIETVPPCNSLRTPCVLVKCWVWQCRRAVTARTPPLCIAAHFFVSSPPFSCLPLSLSMHLMQ